MLGVTTDSVLSILEMIAVSALEMATDADIVVLLDISFVLCGASVECSEDVL